MKQITLLAVVALVFFSSQASAQGKYGATPEDSIECVKCLSFYSEYYKGGNIKESIPSWRGALQKCPEGVNQTLYQQGQSIIKYMLNHKMFTSPQHEAALVDSLIMMYDMRLKHFKTKKYQLSASSYKVFDIVKYCKDDWQRLYDAAIEAVEIGLEETDPLVYVYAIQSAIMLNQEEKLSTNDVMDLYARLSDYFSVKSQTAQGPLAEKVESAQANFEQFFASSGLADCENIINIFGPKFEEKSNELGYVKRLVHLMSKAGCETSDLFFNAVEALYKLEPSYTSAYYLYRLNSSRDNFSEAAKYMQMAIDDPESDAQKDADYMLELGTFYFKNMSNPAKAVEMARQAAQANEALAGKANLLLGHIWASARVEGSEIDGKANFWVAVDYFTKAKQLDSSLSAECDKLIGQYRQYFPTVEDAFMHDLADGKSYTLNWKGISATTTVRTRK